MSQITIRSDRKDDYKFYYKGDEVVLGAGKIISIANGLDEVVLPTCAMKIINNLIVIKEDVKHSHSEEEQA
ncbi:unknown [Fusobacterium sp. CAG:439]|nr:unknown [Fusobacterium sp. CAG:439]